MHGKAALVPADLARTAASGTSEVAAKRAGRSRGGRLPGLQAGGSDKPHAGTAASGGKPQAGTTSISWSILFLQPLYILCNNVDRLFVELYVIAWHDCWGKRVNR